MRYRNLIVVLFALFLSSIVPVTSLTGDPMSGTEGKHDPAGMGYRATPNVVTGFEENTVEVNVDGAAIHGGGRPSFPNRVTGNFGAAGGEKGTLQATVPPFQEDRSIRQVVSVQAWEGVRIILPKASIPP